MITKVSPDFGFSYDRLGVRIGKTENVQEVLSKYENYRVCRLVQLENSRDVIDGILKSFRERYTEPREKLFVTKVENLREMMDVFDHQMILFEEMHKVKKFGLLKNKIIAMKEKSDLMKNVISCYRVENENARKLIKQHKTRADVFGIIATVLLVVSVVEFFLLL